MDYTVELLVRTPRSSTERVCFNIVPQHRQRLACEDMFYVSTSIFPLAERCEKVCEPVNGQRQIRRHGPGELGVGALAEHLGVGPAHLLRERDERQLLPRVEQIAPPGQPLDRYVEDTAHQWQ